MPNLSNTDWNADKIAKLCELWNAGHSAREIGRQMNVSHNSIVGKAHRLNLSPRQSPIKFNGAKKPISERAQQRKTISAVIISETEVRLHRTTYKRVHERQCASVDGGPGNWHYCTEPAVRGSWCTHHAALYIKGQLAG